MFEAAELGRTIEKDEYKKQVPILRTELLEVERQLTPARFPLIVVFGGVDGAGKGETVNLLNAWMDKQWKLTDEDWRNRAKWADYERAVNDMVEQTSTRLAPWTLVEGNDKDFARSKGLKTVCASLERAL